MKDRETKLLLGKLLGETYRIQKHLGLPCSASDVHTYALVNGFDFAISGELRSVGGVSSTRLDEVVEVLTMYSAPEKLATLKGYCDIERTFEAYGIDRDTAKLVLTYFKATDQFLPVINALSTEGSPSELGSFDL